VVNGPGLPVLAEIENLFDRFAQVHMGAKCTQCIDDYIIDAMDVAYVSLA
jgi:hypothetical protein